MDVSTPSICLCLRLGSPHSQDPGLGVYAADRSTARTRVDVLTPRIASRTPVDVFTQQRGLAVYMAARGSARTRV